jgi:hypothetical protein
MVKLIAEQKPADLSPIFGVPGVREWFAVFATGVGPRQDVVGGFIDTAWALRFLGGQGRLWLVDRAGDPPIPLRVSKSGTGVSGRGYEPPWLPARNQPETSAMIRAHGEVEIDFVISPDWRDDKAATTGHRWGWACWVGPRSRL